ncbi:MAG: hypothetical protein U0T84_02105 [Chitinophagales bacterium]
MPALTFILCCLYLLSGGYHTLVLGKGAQCEGFNICTILDGAGGEAEQSIQVLFGLNRDNRPEMLVKKQSVSDQEFLKYFATGYFVLDSDYQLPEQLLPWFNYRHKVFRAGRYPVINTGDYYVVAF